MVYRNKRKSNYNELYRQKQFKKNHYFYMGGKNFGRQQRSALTAKWNVLGKQKKI